MTAMGASSIPVSCRVGHALFGQEEHERRAAREMVLCRMWPLEKRKVQIRQREAGEHQERQESNHKKMKNP